MTSFFSLSLYLAEIWTMNRCFWGPGCSERTNRLFEGRIQKALQDALCRWAGTRHSPLLSPEGAGIWEPWKAVGQLPSTCRLGEMKMPAPSELPRVKGQVALLCIQSNQRHWQVQLPIKCLEHCLKDRTDQHHPKGPVLSSLPFCSPSFCSSILLLMQTPDAPVDVDACYT
jgi:hypothetical protein